MPVVGRAAKGDPRRSFPSSSRARRIRAACAHPCRRNRNEGSCDWSSAASGVHGALRRGSLFDGAACLGVSQVRLFSERAGRHGEVAAVSGALLRERPRRPGDRCHGVRRRGRTRLWHMGSRAFGRDPLSVWRVHVSRPRRGRRTDDDRLSLGAGARVRSGAGVDEPADRRPDGRACSKPTSSSTPRSRGRRRPRASRAASMSKRSLFTRSVT